MKLVSALVCAGAAFAASSYIPKPATIAFLQETLTPEEQEWFIAWGNAPDVNDPIQLVVLETLRLDPHTTKDALREAILVRFPRFAESDNSVKARKTHAMGAAFKPGWFHEILVGWPEPLSPPSEALVDFIIARRPLNSAGEWSSKPLITKRIREWESLCLNPLRLWDGSGAPPCKLRSVVRDGTPQVWAVLSSWRLNQYLDHQLAQYN